MRFKIISGFSEVINIIEFVTKNGSYLDSIIDYNRDYIFDYFMIQNT